MEGVDRQRARQMGGGLLLRERGGQWVSLRKGEPVGTEMGKRDCTSFLSEEDGAVGFLARGFEEGL